MLRYWEEMKSNKHNMRSKFQNKPGNHKWKKQNRDSETIKNNSMVVTADPYKY